MLSTIIVDGKVAGRRRPVFSDWSVPLPPVLEAQGASLTLRELIICVVQAEVKAFQGRQEEQRLQKILSKPEIEAGLLQGRVTLGDRNFNQVINLNDAIDTAIMGFIDGLYYVFLDDIQQEALDAAVHLRPDSRLTFLRLVALVGG
ncbi:MAG: hypothetical protein WA902_10460 [Thermosynechococcaceae cyanobacterium]